VRQRRADVSVVKRQARQPLLAMKDLRSSRDPGVDEDVLPARCMPQQETERVLLGWCTAQVVVVESTEHEAVHHVTDEGVLIEKELPRTRWRGRRWQALHWGAPET